jgi:predicted transcriptional regulator
LSGAGVPVLIKPANSRAVYPNDSVIPSTKRLPASASRRSSKPVPLKPAVPIRRSVQPGYVVCLECGWRGKMLRRHLTTAHQLNGEAYRARWGLSRDYPLTAPDYAK